MNNGVFAAGLLLELLLARGSDAAERPWCELDDPAAYRVALKAAAGAAPSCPVIADPQTMPDELALPMPCDERMVLRKVVVGSETVLDQQTAYLGVPADEEGGLDSLIDGARTTVLAGSFLAGSGPRDPQRPLNQNRLNGRSFYIGKYVVTEPQYRSIALLGTDPAASPSAEACGAFRAGIDGLRDTQVRPASGISWFDAIAFTRAYSNWLLARDRAAIAAGHAPGLPWEQGSPSYIRLPTEAEWEYAARGGAVGRDDQSLRAYRVRDPQTGETRLAEMSEIAVTSDLDGSEQNLLSGVGRKLPNLLGLYDMIGNVDEIVFDLFRLVRPDGLHGQAGGYIVKGGNVFTGENELGVAHRREIPFFELGGEARAKTTGFRIALTTPVFVAAKARDDPWGVGRQNQAFSSALADARAQLVAGHDLAGNQAASSIDALRRESASGQLDLERLKAQLTKIHGDLEHSNTERNEASRQARREKIKAAVLLAYNVHAIGQNILTNTRVFLDLSARLQQRGVTAADRANFQPQLDSIHRRLTELDQSLSASFGFYVDTVAQIAGSDAAERMADADVVRQQFEAQGLSLFDRYEALLQDHSRQLAQSGRPPADAQKRRWLYQIDDTRQMRENQKGGMR